MARKQTISINSDEESLGTQLTYKVIASDFKTYLVVYFDDPGTMHVLTQAQLNPGSTEWLEVKQTTVKVLAMWID